MSKKKRQLLLMVALSVVGVLALSASVLYILRHFGLEAVLILVVSGTGAGWGWVIRWLW